MDTAAPAQVTSQAPAMHVLLVDDEATNRRLGARLLARLGCTFELLEDGDEILPIEYDDNYITVFPGETAHVRGRVPGRDGDAGPVTQWVRVTGYGGTPVVVTVG